MPHCLRDGAQEKGPPSSHEDVDGTENELHLERVLNAGGLEDGVSVVEEVVDAGPLLQEVDKDSQKSPVEKLRDSIWLAGEAFCPGASSSRLLLFNNVVYLLIVVFDKFAVQIFLHASQSGYGHTSVVPSTLTGEPSW